MNAGRLGASAPLVALLLAIVLAIGGLVIPSLAATNDDPSGAIPVTLGVEVELPTDGTFDDTVEPFTWCFYPNNDWMPTVWYQYAPAQDVRVMPMAYRRDPSSGTQSLPVAVYAGMPDSSSYNIYCSYGWADPLTLQVGTVYYFQVGVQRDYYYPPPFESPIPVPDPPPSYFVLHPALQLDITVDDPGGFDTITGDALIGGTVTCNKPSWVWPQQVTVRQTLGRKTTIQGSNWGGNGAECRPEAPARWSVRVRPDSATFGGGWAQVSAEVYGSGELNGDWDNDATVVNVRLRNTTER